MLTKSFSLLVLIIAIQLSQVQIYAKKPEAIVTTPKSESTSEANTKVQKSADAAEAKAKSFTHFTRNPKGWSFEAHLPVPPPDEDLPEEKDSNCYKRIIATVPQPYEEYFETIFNNIPCPKAAGIMHLHASVISYDPKYSQPLENDSYGAEVRVIAFKDIEYRYTFNFKRRRLINSKEWSHPSIRYSYHKLSAAWTLGWYTSSIRKPITYATIGGNFRIIKSPTKDTSGRSITFVDTLKPIKDEVAPTFLVFTIVYKASPSPPLQDESTKKEYEFKRQYYFGEDPNKIHPNRPSMYTQNSYTESSRPMYYYPYYPLYPLYPPYPPTTPYAPPARPAPSQPQLPLPTQHTVSYGPSSGNSKIPTITIHSS